MTENEIGKIIIDCAVQLHKELGPGLFESVYEAIMAHDLRQKGLQVERQVPIPILFRGMKLGYLLNFGEALMKDGISRILNGVIE